MKFIKTKLDDITRCYCTSHINIDDKCYLLFASEDPKSTKEELIKQVQKDEEQARKLLG